MKKSKYALIGSILILAMMLGQITTVRGTTYSCAGVVGAEAVWRVKTVHNGSLANIFGASPTWESAIQTSFGPDSHKVGARLKTVVASVNASEMMPTPIGFVELCLIYSDLWVWTTSDFASTPDINDTMTLIWMHPENLTLICQTTSGFTRNVSQVWAFPFLNALPGPAATYLSELIWDNDYSVSGTTVTHNLVAPYVGLGAVFLVDCTESWRYSNSYGTFLGYKLVHNNGTVAYETVIETAGGIPGFELPIVISVSMGIMISLIYVVMKKKR